MKQFFAGILQNWLEDPQKWLTEHVHLYFFAKECFLKIILEALNIM